MTLDEVIRHARETAKKLRDMTSVTNGRPYEECLECAREHEQLAEWLEELAERREADKWISTKERMPEKDGGYLVVVEFQHILLVTYYDAENEHWGTANSVIAWKPLPKPYESEAEND